MDKSSNNNSNEIKDSIFSGIQKFLPHVLGLNSKTSKIVGLIENKILGTNALSTAPMSIRGLVGLTGNKTADLGILTVLSVLTFSKLIKNDKKAFVFHVGFLSLAAANYYFTDYDSKEEEKNRD